MKKILTVSVLFIIGGFFFLRGQELPEEAKRYYDKGCEILKTAKIPKDYEDAIKEFSNAIALDPNFPESYNKLGEVYEKLEKYQEAIDNFNKCLSFITDSTRRTELETKINKLEYKRDKFNKTVGKIAALMGDWYGVTNGNRVQHFKFYKEGDIIMVQADSESLIDSGPSWVSPKTFPVNFEGKDTIKFTLNVQHTWIASDMNYLNQNVNYKFEMKIVSDKLMVGTLKYHFLKYNQESKACQILSRIPNPSIYSAAHNYFSGPSCDFDINGFITYLNSFY